MNISIANNQQIFNGLNIYQAILSQSDLYTTQKMFLKKFNTISRLYFSTQQAQQGLQSIAGHKPPTIADTPAGRYAGSLFTAASKNEALQTVLSDLGHLEKVIQATPNIREFLKNSAIKRSQQREVINSFAKNNYHQITNHFLDTVIEAGRLSDLEKIIQTYITYCKILNKEEDIKVISAKELNQQEKEQVVQAYKKNKPDVRFKITYQVDPLILGGLQIYAGSEFLDCSLRSRITKLKSELAKI